MYNNFSENRAGKVVGLLFVLAIHLGLLYLAMSYKLIPPPQEALVMMVDLINPPKKEEPPPPPEPPKPEPPKEVKLVKEKPIKPKPEPKPILAVEAPAETPTEFVVEKQPEPDPAPVKEEEPAPQAVEPAAEPAKPSAPVQMSELSVGCSHRPEPNYPPASRRMGEQGQVKLRVELDESGHIGTVKVIESSGSARLDNAGMATVKNWRCEAATRDGKPTRAIATQVFDFKLE
ncbi:MAG TPA: energy transducer TonB [Methylotenera sp.]|nr:energy transducer TonB [Methylotenera sp.]HPH08396.1 energy transducer TonB [Methylotenera sp.]HPM48670.1 energy transducer TonB [Methylotenera sp.]